MTSSDLIKKAAARSGVTITGLAKATGISRQTLAAWSSRDKISPTGAALMRILSIMGEDALRHAAPPPNPKKAKPTK